jgi:hypothetical protein
VNRDEVNSAWLFRPAIVNAMRRFLTTSSAEGR